MRHFPLPNRQVIRCDRGVALGRCAQIFVFLDEGLKRGGGESGHPNRRPYSWLHFSNAGTMVRVLISIKVSSFNKIEKKPGTWSLHSVDEHVSLAAANRRLSIPALWVAGHASRLRAWRLLAAARRGRAGPRESPIPLSQGGCCFSGGRPV